MERRDIITGKCNLNGIGLEIGPSINPILPKQDGYNVETIDHTDKQGLIDKYKPHGKNIEKIEEVDYIWNGESYADLTGKKNYYDYIIASHVIEHTCDLISFLRECSEVLNENGVLSLVIPDKRFCFDYLRPVTSISKVIDCHINNKTFNTPGSVYEYFGSVCQYHGNLAWDCPLAPPEVKNIHSVSEAVNAYNEVLSEEKFIDIHNWVFTKSSFELLIYDLNCLDLIDLVVIADFETCGHEFYISLQKRHEPFEGNTQERTKLALKLKNELEPTDSDGYYSKQIQGYEHYIESQQEQIKTQKDQIKEQQEQIIDIYNSKTYKTGEKIQKIYKLFKPSKVKQGIKEEKK